MLAEEEALLRTGGGSTRLAPAGLSPGVPPRQLGSLLKCKCPRTTPADSDSEDCRKFLKPAFPTKCLTPAGDGAAPQTLDALLHTLGLTGSSPLLAFQAASSWG